VPESRDGLINYHLPAGATKSVAYRTVKLVAPQCRLLLGTNTDSKGRTVHEWRSPCTEGPHTPDWFRTCPHDPYFHEQEVPEVVEDREPQPDGTYIITNRRVVPRVRRMPNLRQVPHSPRHLGFALRKKLRKGWAMPEQLGILPFCQFMDCWSQDLPEEWRDTTHGDYCSREHAIEMAAQMEQVNLHVADGPDGRARRQRQLDRVAFR
jgi:hypothetical protein